MGIVDVVSQCWVALGCSMVVMFHNVQLLLLLQSFQMGLGAVKRDSVVVVESVVILLGGRFGSLNVSESLGLGCDFVGHIVLVGWVNRMFSVVPERFVVGSLFDVVFHLR